MATLTLQPASGIDAAIDSYRPTTNLGSDYLFAVGYDNQRIYRQLIKFDLSALPSGADITSATLSWYVNIDVSTNQTTYRVYRLKRAWVESQVTWSIYSTGNSWQVAGGFGANDCEQVDIGSRIFTAAETTNEFKDFALTPTTKAGLDLGNGWLIKADNESVQAQYRGFSSDWDTAAQRPKLVIEYTGSIPAIAMDVYRHRRCG